MKTYSVTIPISGVAYATVSLDDSATPDDIFNAAVDQILENNKIDEWEPMKEVHRGNLWMSEHPAEWDYEE